MNGKYRGGFHPCIQEECRIECRVRAGNLERVVCATLKPGEDLQELRRMLLREARRLLAAASADLERSANRKA